MLIKDTMNILRSQSVGRVGRETMVTCISLVRQHFNLDTTGTTHTARTGRETMAYELYSW